MKVSIIKKLMVCSFFIATALQSLAQVEEDEQQYIQEAPFKSTIHEPVFPNKIFSIKDYGGSSDGVTLNTTAIAKAIDACANAGGGHVIIPSGLWLTGPIQLKSNVDLHLERGALVQFTPDHSQFPIIKASATSNSFVVASPVYGYSLKNIAITGEGILDGAGETWRPVKKIKTTAAQWKDFTASGVVSKDGSVWWPNEEAMQGEAYLNNLKKSKSKPDSADYLPARDYMRPYMVYLVNCENILVQGVTIRNSPRFVFYPNYCNNLIMRHVNIFNEWWAQNGDGIDISASKNVLIYKCNVSAGDDGICMKSSGKIKSADDALLENIIIAGCNVYHAHGGFVIGSNTDGGMRNVYVTNCNFIGTDIGLRIKSNAGRGGLVHDIFINNIHMSDIVNEAISFDTYYQDVPAGKERTTIVAVKDKTPVFRDFHISNIVCHGANTAISITGLPEMPVQKIYFENIMISAKNQYKSVDAKDISMKNVKVLSSGKIFEL